MAKNNGPETQKPPLLWRYRVSPLFSVEAPIEFSHRQSLEQQELSALLTGSGIVLGWLRNLREGKFNSPDKNPQNAPLYGVSNPENTVWGKDTITNLLKDLDNIYNPKNSPQQRQELARKILIFSRQVGRMEEFSVDESQSRWKKAIKINNKKELVFTLIKAQSVLHEEIVQELSYIDGILDTPKEREVQKSNLDDSLLFMINFLENLPENIADMFKIGEMDVVSLYNQLHSLVIKEKNIAVKLVSIRDTNMPVLKNIIFNQNLMRLFILKTIQNAREANAGNLSIQFESRKEDEKEYLVIVCEDDGKGNLSNESSDSMRILTDIFEEDFDSSIMVYSLSDKTGRRNKKGTRVEAHIPFATNQDEINVLEAFDRY